VVNYRAEPRGIQPLRASLSLSVVYAGYKTPTPEVISTIEKIRKLHPERFEQLFHLIDDCVKDATVAIRNGNLKQLGELVNLHHGLQSAMGCSDETLEYLIYQLRKQEGISGAKISGSGLGDCVIGLGNSEAKVSGYDHFSIDVDPEGVRFEN
jgi:mevalonate kinase